MSDKRMLSTQIVESDAFLDLPLSAQSLYFHLTMNADDDGFINSPKRIQRMIGAADSDLDILYERRFLLRFESGVTVIKHWLINNTIRADRKKDTPYTEELAQLKIKANGAYTLAQEPEKTEAQPLDNQMTTNPQPNDNQTSPEAQPNDRVNKVNINKFNNSVCNACACEEEMQDVSREIMLEQFNAFWDEYPKHENKDAACRMWISLNPGNELAAEIIKAVRENKDKNGGWKRNGGRYIPRADKWLLDRRWLDEIHEETDDPTPQKKNQFNDYEQRQYTKQDYDELELKMRRRGLK